MLRSLLLSFTFLSLVILVTAGAEYYKILGVGRKASDAEIKKAYKKLSKQYHPDKKGGDKDKFVEVARGLCFCCTLPTRSSHASLDPKPMKYFQIQK